MPIAPAEDEGGRRVGEQVRRHEPYKRVLRCGGRCGGSRWKEVVPQLDELSGGQRAAVTGRSELIAAGDFNASEYLILPKLIPGADVQPEAVIGPASEDAAKVGIAGHAKGAVGARAIACR